MRRIAIVASASGNGKTTLGRELAQRLGVPFVELDSLVHGPGWVETSDAELRARVEPIVASDAWVIDGTYVRKLGDLVMQGADTVVWLDLPLPLVLWRLLRRTAARVALRQELWNGNRESLRTALVGRESLFVFAVRTHLRRRREWPTRLRAYPVVRLRSRAEMARFLEDATRS